MSKMIRSLGAWSSGFLRRAWSGVVPVSMRSGTGWSSRSTVGGNGFEGADEFKKSKDVDWKILLIPVRERVLLLRSRLPLIQSHDGNVSAKHGRWLLWAGKTLQAALCLENAVINYENTLSPHDIALGYAYRDLGTCYLDMAQLGSAMKLFLRASRIPHDAVGCYHPYSIHACQDLVYASAREPNDLSKLHIAIKYQNEVIRRWSEIEKYDGVDKIGVQWYLVKAQRYLKLLERENSGFYQY